jgi:ADP-ribosylglycohydrolase
VNAKSAKPLRGEPQPAGGRTRKAKAVAGNGDPARGAKGELGNGSARLEAAPAEPRAKRANRRQLKAAQDSRADRAHGALAGLALGDALGMPTQSMPRDQIAKEFGRVAELRDAPDNQPIAPGLKAGTVTDDTAQALIVADLLVKGRGRIDPAELAAALAAWEADMIRRGSHDLLGTSTKAALAALRAGVPVEESGKGGTTNGAAMRIAPVGIVQIPTSALWDRVREATAVTHGANLGLAAAYGVAAAVSVGVDGADSADAVIAGIAAAHFGAQRGFWVAGADIAARFDALAPAARELGAAPFERFLYEVVGTSVHSQESIVAAFLLVDRFADDPRAALTAAASLGGDTDTIAAVAGAILGATHGAGAFPAAELAQVEEVNGLDLRETASRLLALRD